jgi:hypothetical protein
MSPPVFHSVKKILKQYTINPVEFIYASPNRNYRSKTCQTDASIWHSRVDYNSLGCGNPWGHVDIFIVENFTKLFPEETGTLGLVLYSHGLNRFRATPCISTKS